MKKIKLFDPVIGISEEREVIKILRSGFWASGSGRGKVQKLEKKFSNYLNSDQCIAVNSGTAALNLSLSLLDIKNKIYSDYHLLRPYNNFKQINDYIVNLL